MRTHFRLLATLGAALAALPGLARAERPAAPDAASWFAAYQRDGHRVSIGRGRVLTLYCVGNGSPTVILEAGIGGTAFDWRTVQHPMGGTRQVCAYDRAGSGGSTPGPVPRDTRAQVADLEALIRAAHLRPPFILVGHSMGGFIVRLFASRHPGQVAGLVLVDPSVENQILRMRAVAPAIAANDERSMRRMRACADAARSAEVARLCTRPAPDGFPPDLAATFVAQRGLAAAQAVLSEVESFLAVDSGEVVAERHPLGAMPLIVLTRGERSGDLPADQAEAELTLLNQMHDEIARLSTIGFNHMVPEAGHYIQIDRPNAVMDAVDEVTARARRR